MPASTRRLGRLVLVRHGESEGNRDRTFTRSGQVPLTVNGRDQARRAAQLIARQFAAVRLISSPYRRAHDTAAIVAEELDLAVETDDRFREQSLGQLAGQPYDVVRQDPNFDLAQRWTWQPPQGESLAAVRDRVSLALDEVARAHPEEDVVVVSHGGVMFALWAHVAGSWEQARPAGNAGIVLIEHDRDGYREPRLVDRGGAVGDAATLALRG